VNGLLLQVVHRLLNRTVKRKDKLLRLKTIVEKLNLFSADTGFE